MRLSIVVIGDEILLGQVTDTNSGAIARTFGPEGWTVTRTVVVGDDAASIRQTIQSALATTDLVITTGGLGPTKDDITKGVMLDIFGGELRHDPSVADNIREVFGRRGLTLNPLTEAQAMVPDTCRVVQNRLGTAPIMWFESNGKVLVAMPGVPFETEGMLPEVAGLVKEHFAPEQRLLHHTLMAAGITESDLATHLEDFENALSPGLHLAYLPQPGIIRLRLDGTNVPDAVFSKTVSQLKTLLGHYLLHDGDSCPAKILLKGLLDKELTCATAESCTGGNIAHSITAVPGSSAAFLGGIVSYANEVKVSLLDVGKETLRRCGAVSREVVEQMAAGACRATGADCAMATSGIAGPGGGTPDKPVGTVWIGWAVKGHIDSRMFRFPGNRMRVIDRATTEAILGLISRLKNAQ